MVVIFAVAALLAPMGCGSPRSTTPPPASGSGHISAAGSGQASAPSGRPRPGIVAVTGSGALVVLNSSAGTIARTLVRSGVVGEEIAVSPDGSTVYFTAGSGCSNKIEFIPVSGGTPASIAAGILPAISPDGTRFAFAQEPMFLPAKCASPSPFAGYFLEVRTLSSGSQKSYPMATAASAPGLPIPILYLSWAPGNASPAVTMSGIQDNQGRNLNILSTASAQYYLTGRGDTTVPVSGPPDPSRSYYQEAAYLRDGNLFVSHSCCKDAGPQNPAPADSSLLQEISTRAA